MSRLGLISDIHGNLVALDAVLADMTARRVDEIICLGDIAAGGPQPREVISRLRELGCPAVRGNGEGWLLDGLPPGHSEATLRLAEVVRWTHELLTATDFEYLAALPTTLTATIGSLTLFCFHGSPRADVESLLATTSDHDLNEALADTPASRILAGGHTHLQLLRPFDRRLLVNPGSVGLPLGSVATGPCSLPQWAEYAIVDADGGDIGLAFRRVTVDVNAVAAATATMPHPSWAVDLERRIRRWNTRASR